MRQFTLSKKGIGNHKEKGAHKIYPIQYSEKQINEAIYRRSETREPLDTDTTVKERSVGIPVKYFDISLLTNRRFRSRIIRIMIISSFVPQY